MPKELRPKPIDTGEGATGRSAAPVDATAAGPARRPAGPKAPGTNKPSAPALVTEPLTPKKQHRHEPFIYSWVGGYTVLAVEPDDDKSAFVVVPRLERMTIEAGINGVVHRKGQRPNIAGLLANLRLSGRTVIPYDAGGGYAVEDPPGSDSWREPWARYSGATGRDIVVPPSGYRGFVGWLQTLVSEGVIPEPDQAALANLAAAIRTRLDRLPEHATAARARALSELAAVDRTPAADDVDAGRYGAPSFDDGGER